MMMSDYKLWKLKCPKCGFSFVVGTSANLPERSVKDLKECPCGAEMQECENMPPYNELGRMDGWQDA